MGAVGCRRNPIFDWGSNPRSPETLKSIKNNQKKANVNHGWARTAQNQYQDSRSAIAPQRLDIRLVQK